MAKRGVTLLGSTGSIGTHTLAVLAREPAQFRIVALTANGSVDALYEQCLRFEPEFAVLSQPADAERMRQRLRQAGSKAYVGRLFRRIGS